MNPLGPDPKNAWKASDAGIDLTRAASGQRPIQFEAELAPIRIDLAKTALVVVDMQKFFCDVREDEDPETKPSRQPIEPLSHLLPLLRRASVPIIWLNWGNRPDEANLPPGVRYTFNRRRVADPRPFLTSGTEPTEVVKELTPEDGDIHVDKYRLSGFWDTPLDSILRGRRIDTVLFAGVNLDQCVYHTLADAPLSGLRLRATARLRGNQFP